MPPHSHGAQLLYKEVKIAAIINPVSGAGADTAVAGRRIAMLRAELERRGLTAAIDLTTSAGHAKQLAAAAVHDGADVVIVWGGDGTVNEAGSALLNTRSALGLVPAGSGNGLAGALAMTRDSATAIAVALDGRTRAIDAGLIGDRPFFNIGGIGFDARVAKLFNLRARGSRGGWPYFSIGIREGCRYAAEEYDLQLDGEPRRLRALLMSFANGREYGMGARIAPQAELDDGILDVTIVEERPILARFWHARHLAFGTAHLAPHVLVRRVRHASVESTGPLEYHVDGEPGIAHGKLEVKVLPRALNVRVA